MQKYPSISFMKTALLAKTTYTFMKVEYRNEDIRQRIQYQTLDMRTVVTRWYRRW